DPAWLHLSPATFELEAGASALVDVWLEVPPTAEPGGYHSRLRASFVPAPGEGATAVSVQAAVASDLRFAVEQREVTSFDRVHSLWRRYGIGAMLATGAGTLTFLFVFATSHF